MSFLETLRGFGIVLVRGLNLVPRPPTRIMASIIILHLRSDVLMLCRQRLVG